MKTVIEIAKQVYGAHVEFNEAQTQRLQEIEALIRDDERAIWMERTAILIRGEREACAQVCEGRLQEGLNFEGCAAAIRARGETSIRSNT